MQSPEVPRAERIRKEPKDASVPEVDLFLPLEAPRPPRPAPSRRTRASSTWRRLALAAITVAVLAGVSLHVERAFRKRQEEAAAAAAAERQREQERLLAAESAEKARRRLEAAAAEQEAGQVRAMAAKIELEAVAQRKAAEAAEAARRAASWEQFYKPNPSCRNAWTVDCANAYIRAKRRFEAQTP